MAPPSSLTVRRWQEEAREAFGTTLPPWTREDDSDDEEGGDFEPAPLRLRKRGLRRRHVIRVLPTKATATSDIPTAALAGRAPQASPTTIGSDDDSPDSPDSNPDTESGSASEGEVEEEETQDRKEPQHPHLPPPPPPPSATAEPTVSATQETSTVSQSSTFAAAEPAVSATGTEPDSALQPSQTVSMVMTTLIGLAPPPPPVGSPQKTFTLGSIISRESSQIVVTSKMSATTVDEAASSSITSAIESSGIVAAPAIGFSSGIRKGVDGSRGTALPVFSATSSCTSWLTTTSLASAAPAATREADNEKITKTDGMAKTDKIAIGVGTVGGIILLTGFCWLAWVLFKRSRGRRSNYGDDSSFGKPGRGTRFLANIPFFKDRSTTRGWSNIDDSTPRGMSEKKPSISPSSSVSNRRLDSQFFAPDQPMGIAFSSPDKPPSLQMPDGVSPASTMLAGTTQVDTNNTTRHLPKESVSSTQAHYNQTMRTVVPYTNVDNAGNTLDSYYVTKRQTGLSEMSSISSGFGDGDIIIAPRSAGLVTPLRHPPVAAMPANNGPRYSWRSQLSPNDARRDTVYTEASEDTPARFRTVHSWVRQQTGRVKRAQQKGGDDQAPPVPVIPPEQEFTMMMPDGEEPRRVEVPPPTAHGVAS